MGDKPPQLKKTRLDVLLVERGLAASRERARALVLAGAVRVDGHRVTKAGAATAVDASLELDVPDHPYVGRGGVKLAHALDHFAIDVRGMIGLDIGASTGGFTDVLLQRGAVRVAAIDVGHNQLDWKLRSDPRVFSREGLNARALAPGDLPAGLRTFDIITIDVSFISLRHILPVLPPLLAPTGHVVALVKPQFESRREEVGKGGIVRDDVVHSRVAAEVTAAADALGLVRAGLIDSPITGMEGNKEFLLWLRPRPAAADGG